MNIINSLAAMLLAFVRLLAITAVVIFSLFLAVLGLQHLGSDQQYADFEHPLKQKKFWAVVLTAASAKSMPMDAIAGARVQQLADLSLVVWPENFIRENGKVRFLGQLSPEEWRALRPEALSFEQFTLQFSDHPIYLEINLPQVMSVKDLRDIIRDNRSDNDVMIQTSSQTLKKSLKKLEPQWLYGATAAEAGKFRFTTALYLHGIVEAAFDFISMPSFTERQLADLDRRNIRALLSEPEPPLNKAELQKQSIDGIVTLHPVLPTEPIER